MRHRASATAVPSEFRGNYVLQPQYRAQIGCDSCEVAFPSQSRVFWVPVVLPACSARGLRVLLAWLLAAKVAASPPFKRG